MLAPTHDASLPASQQEAVISLTPECLCSPTVEIFFDEKQRVVQCVCARVFLFSLCAVQQEIAGGCKTESILAATLSNHRIHKRTHAHTHTAALPKLNLAERGEWVGGGASEVQPGVCSICRASCSFVITGQGWPKRKK